MHPARSRVTREQDEQRKAVGTTRGGNVDGEVAFGRVPPGVVRQDLATEAVVLDRAADRFRKHAVALRFEWDTPGHRGPLRAKTRRPQEGAGRRGPGRPWGRGHADRTRLRTRWLRPSSTSVRTAYEALRLWRSMLSEPSSACWLDGRHDGPSFRALVGSPGRCRVSSSRPSRPWAPSRGGLGNGAEWPGRTRGARGSGGRRCGFDANSTGFAPRTRVSGALAVGAFRSRRVTS